MDKKRMTDLANAVLDGVGFGGFEGIEQIAEDGWPEDAHLTEDSPELRELIQERAQEIVDEEDGEDGEDGEEDEDEESEEEDEE